MKSVHKGRKAGGPNQFLYPNWCWGGGFEPLVFICLTPLLLLMFVMKLKPSQNNKILQIF
jgi:hypothetical protein